MDKRRLLTGDRPTGKLHLGHHVGTLQNRVRLQDDYECYFVVADYHMLTTRLEDLAEIEGNIRDVVLDYLSVGIDPNRSTIYLQSLVPEVTELHLLFSMLVPVPRLQRVPTLKDMIRDLKLENPSYGLLGYPVLQAADILMVKAEAVPVGRDQLPHIEVTREIARRFNQLFGSVLPEPDALVGDVPSLVGTDGHTKMSKSLGNAIFLSDDPETVNKKVIGMYTDPRRIHPDIPGRVEGNPVFVYHDLFNKDRDEVDALKHRYRMGTVGDVEVKRRLSSALNEFLDPIRQRRAQFAKDPGIVRDIIANGSARAAQEARATLAQVRQAMHLDYFRDVGQP
ncbi:MAG: tryptophan--tRNA ligase [Chloroflexi bacterium]|nr:tryptophan--tRNA ligase [Chloroflexota bacterium]